MAPIRELRVGPQFLGFRSGMRSLRRAILENGSVCRLRQAVQWVRDHWLAFGFTRRFYRQACRTQPGGVPVSMPTLDLTECLFQRSLPPHLHALVQLRVASQIASLSEAAARSAVCRQCGWSDDFIRAVATGAARESFSEPEQLALRYADEVTRTPIDVDPLTVRQLRQHFNQGELVELTASIVYENFRCRFTDAQSRLS